MFRIILIFVATTLLSGNALGTPPARESINVISQVTLDSLDIVNGLEVRKGSIFVYGQNNGGKITQYIWNDKRFISTGYQNGISLSSPNHNIDNPTGVTYHENLGTFIGNSTPKNKQLFYVDWDILKNSRNLNWAVLNVVEDDLAKNTSIPEFVTYNGEWLVASVDSGLLHSTVRLYDPFELQQANFTSDSGVLRYSFKCPSGVTGLYWHNSTSELLLTRSTAIGRWEIVSLYIDDAVLNEETEFISTTYPARRDWLRGFHYLFGTNSAAAVSSGRKNTLSAIQITEDATP